MSKKKENLNDNPEVKANGAATECIPFAVVEMISRSLSKFKAPLWDDICKFKKITEVLDEVEADKLNKSVKMREEFQEKFGIEDLSKIEEGSEQMAEINAAYQTRILRGTSNVSVDKLRLFTEKEFSRIYNQEEFTAMDAVAISHWIVKQ